MNKLTICLIAGASALEVQRAHAAIDAWSGNFIAATLESTDSVAFNSEGVATRNIEQVATFQANAELDAAGLPWDERIHAGTKTKTQKNEWTKRKGVADNVVAAVTAELRQLYPPVPAATATPAVANTVPVVGVPKVGPVVGIVPKSEYQKLVDFIAVNTANQKIAQETIDATFAQYSTSLAALAGDEESSKAYREAFESFLAG